MKNSFSKTYEIESFNSDFTYHATPLYYLKLIQDISGYHATNLGLSIPKLQGQGKTWVVLRTKMEIESYPYWQEQLTVNTVALNPHIFYFPRSIDIIHSNKVVCKASTLWTIIDTKSYRPQKPNDYMKYFGEVTQERDHITKLRKNYNFDDSYNLIVTKNFLVTPGFGDINNHVNNIHYFNWILKNLPKYLTTEYSVSMLDISWIKQTFVDDNVSIKIYEKKDSENINLIFNISRDKTIVCQGEIDMKPRASMIIPIQNKLLIP